MRFIMIEALPNGAHENMRKQSSKVPDGWALIPDDMETENFPFGDIEVAEIDGVITVTSWTPGVIPEPDPIPEPEPTTTDLMDVLLGVSV